MAAAGKFGIPRLQGVMLWAPITGLLALGLLTTLIDLRNVPAAEALRATRAEQRVVINAVSGEVMRAAEAPATEEVGFDVDTTEESTVAPQGEAMPSEAPDVASTDEASSATEAPASNETAESAPVAEVTTEEVEPIIDGAETLRTAPLFSQLTAPTPTKYSLVPAPAPEITETIDGKSLPKRGANDVIPSKLYAHPFTRKPDQILLSFVVMDAGIDPQAVGLLMALPPEVSVAYSPYARPATSYVDHVRATGHEVWTMLPTVNTSYPATDPGPLGIISRMPAEEVTRRTREVLAAIIGSVGLILPPDETIAAQRDSLTPVLNEINTRGLLMLTTNPSRNIDQVTSNPSFKELIRRADLVIEDTATETEILSKLAGVVASATEKGEYVVMLPSHPQSIKLLTEWLQKNPPAEPVVLAPLSAIYQPKEAVEKPAAEADKAAAKKEKPKPKPPEKKQKPLPQDQYLKPAGDAKAGEKSSGGH